MSACASARRRRRPRSGCKRARQSLSSASCPFASGKARTARRGISPRSSRTTSSSCRTVVAMEPPAAPAPVRRPRPTVAATAKPRSAPTSTMSRALSDIGPRNSCPLTLARMVERRGAETSSRFSPLFWAWLPGAAAGTTLSHSSKLIRTGVRKTNKTTKKWKRDKHVQRTTAAARRPDDDSHRGQDRRRTDRNDLSETEWREGREPGGQYAAVRHWYARRAGSRTARADRRVRRGAGQVPQQPGPDQTATRRCCNRRGRSGEEIGRASCRERV